MKTSDTGRKFIGDYEGLSLVAYDDAYPLTHKLQAGDKVRGTLTIGYGHTSAAGAPKVFIGQTITKAQADSILAADLASVEADVSRLVKVPLNQNQFDALVSFHYNTGSLGKASLLTYLNKGDYKEAANRFALYNKGRQNGALVVMSGLIRRRADEKKMFLSSTKPGVAAPVAAVIVAGSTSAYNWPHIAAYIILGTVVVLMGVSIYSFIKDKNKQNVTVIK